MQTKGRDSIGTFLKQNAASSVPRPAEAAEVRKAAGEMEPEWLKSLAPSSSREAPQPAPPPAEPSADRIVAYLKANGPSPTVRIVQDLALSLDDAVQTLERLESFGFVTVDRSDGKATVTLSQ